jgi:hypothetical protein
VQIDQLERQSLHDRCYRCVYQLRDGTPFTAEQKPYSMITMVLVAALLHNVLATLPTDTDCGVPSIAAKPKIIGGIEATPYSWPWQVQIRYFGGHLCGGAVVSPGMLVTYARAYIPNILSLSTMLT